MISLADALAMVALVGLIAYALLGGADFGGGLWDILASGPRTARQRVLIERSIAPVWEANHVWLILVIVLLFSGFPPAFSAMSIALHIPLTLMLIGIVLRGAAFTFRQYDPERKKSEILWGRVFALSSIIAPFFLGVCLASITQGSIRVSNGIPTTGFFWPWIGWFQFSVGLFAVALFAFLAAVYLTLETDDRELQDDFRIRALISGAVVGFFALVTGLLASEHAQEFQGKLLSSWWTWPLQIGTGLAAIGAFASLWHREYRLARFLAATQVSLILVGWASSQHPFLIYPDIRIAEAAAPDSTLRLLLIALSAGVFVLFPSLYWLFRIFKSGKTRSV
ncbi:MAG: cytochrome BD ubiquinol oxidase subunit II [Bdellovibrionales bacterium GWB1_55_8]|nr:MAG: cytochrome BD ubiquinol oxidase subunit II [Bdellovibrionales bacterium GWB1_55_8]